MQRHDNLTEPRVTTALPLAKRIDGRLVFLVPGSLAAGRPRYAPDAQLAARVREG